MRARTPEEAGQAFDAAPKTIQDALSDGPVIDFMVKLRDRYGLHVDTAGIVTGDIRDLVLGLASPGEFFEGLRELGIPDGTAKTLISDLNKEVFIPLREQVVSGGTTVDAQSAPARDMRVPLPATRTIAPSLVPAPTLVPEALPVPEGLPPAPPPATAAVNRLAQEPITTLPGSPEPAPMPTLAPQAQLQSSASFPVVPATPAAARAIPEPAAPFTAPLEAPVSGRPAMRTMAQDMELARQEPEHPAHAPFPEPSVPSAWTAPAVPVPPRPATPAPATPKIPISKEYSADPYREPI